MKDTQVGWALIPPHIIARQDLSANEKLVYGRILGLTGNEGYCYASNLWLGQQIGLKADSISAIIKKLKDKNLIKVIIKRDDNSKVISRQIFVRGIDSDRIPPLSSSDTLPYDDQKNSVENSVESSMSNTTSDNNLKPISRGNTSSWMERRRAHINKKQQTYRPSMTKTYTEKKEKGVFHAEDIL